MSETTEATPVEEKPVYGNVSIEELDAPEYSDDQVEEMMALYDESFSGIKEGEIVKGKVMTVTASDVLVDIGFKSEGAVPLKEFGEDTSAIEIGADIGTLQDRTGSIARVSFCDRRKHDRN